MVSGWGTYNQTCAASRRMFGVSHGSTEVLNEGILDHVGYLGWTSYYADSKMRSWGNHFCKKIKIARCVAYIVSWVTPSYIYMVIS